MPIFDHSYRHLERPLEAPRQRWTVIARLGIVERLARRWFDLLLVVALLPWLYYLVRLVVELRLPDLIPDVASTPQFMEYVAIGPGSFLRLLEIQLRFAFLVTIFAGAGLVSGDLRTRALPLYLSKPITRSDYVLGKLLVCAFFVSLVTLLPVEILLFLKVMTSDGLSFFFQHPLLPAQILLSSLLVMTVMSALMLAMSAVSRSAWVPGLGFAILYMFGRAFALLLKLMLKSDVPLLLSLRDNIVRVMQGLFGQAPSTGPSWLLSLLVLAGLTGLSMLVLSHRVRGVEVVAS